MDKSTDFNNNNDAEFNIAAKAILTITSTTATAITTLIPPILMKLNNLLSCKEEDGEDNKQPQL